MLSDFALLCHSFAHAGKMWKGGVAVVKKKLPLLARHCGSAVRAAQDNVEHQACSSSTSSRVLAVWAWGKGDAGQLGLGDEDHQPSPRYVTAFTETRPAKPTSGVLPTAGRRSHDATTTTTTSSSPVSAGVACGLFHSGYWANGQLWMWGKGDGGRLGLGTEQSAYVPQLNRHVQEPVRTAALGGLHTMALTLDGAVYTW